VKTAPVVEFAISAEPLDVARLKQTLTSASAGACVCFEGWVRNENEGAGVISLEYEAHAALAAKLGRAILEDACQRFEVLQLSCRHRVGRLDIGDCAVWVGASAAHRGAAFDACRYVIDQVKHEVPIWKKEHYRNGNSGWVNCATGAARDRPDPAS
jgi:molybdopterin synthase catalytic subunit